MGVCCCCAVRLVGLIVAGCVIKDMSGCGVVELRVCLCMVVGVCVCVGECVEGEPSWAALLCVAVTLK